MLSSIIRKATQVIDDPVLRRWLIGRALRKFAKEPSFAAHQPPYLKNLLPLGSERPAPPQEFRDLGPAHPTGSIELSLPGLTLPLNPGEEHDLFDRSFADTETLLAVHRFAWLPLFGDRIDPVWVGAIWNTWRKRYEEPDDSWAWHPYTAAERAINILRFARQHGLPGAREETIACLARHATAIAGTLEYFGDHHTSNHLANNGRGLFLLGLWLGMPKAADLGGRILIEEAARIFHTSGMLREGSSHYHLLLAKNYAEAAHEAETHGREEAPALRQIANKARAVASMLVLPGGLPLIGDISPDLPPRMLLEDFKDAPAESGSQDANGWLRFDHGPWSGLWHLAPEGWRQMPGHGHEDAGGFEIHYKDTPLFIDPGRSSYGKSGDVDCSGQAHNTLLVDGKDPYPPNRPYYDDHFRQLICGNKPELGRSDRGVQVHHDGFARLRDVGNVTRQWSFDKTSFTVDDRVAGRGKHTLTRLLTTPLAADVIDDAVILQNAEASFRVSAPGSRPALVPVARWTAYGEGSPVTQIRFESKVALPWRGEIVIDQI